MVTPLLAWLAAGSLKFVINSLRARRLAFDLIGYGGLPSTHTTVVVSMASLVAFREGVDGPAFGIALTFAFIVILDAVSLRRRIGDHAAAINRLDRGAGGGAALRERIGHTPLEVAAGTLLGVLLGWLLSMA